MFRLAVAEPVGTVTVTGVPTIGPLTSTAVGELAGSASVTVAVTGSPACAVVGLRLMARTRGASTVTVADCDVPLSVAVIVAATFALTAVVPMVKVAAALPAGMTTD